MLKLFRGYKQRLRAKKIVSNHVDEKRVKYDDRNVLEIVIIPWLLTDLDPRRILDVGREEYEHFYNEFFEGRELWTMDVDPERKEFGADKHIVDSVANLKKHFPADFFDVVLMNGVFGWGLNEKEEIETALTGIYECLRPGGLLIFGYNKTGELIPVPLKEIKALKRFQPYKCRPLKGSSFTCSTGEHTYNFYQKPCTT